MKRNIYPPISKTALLALALLFFANPAMAQFTVSGTLETPEGDHVSGFPILVTGTENKIAYTGLGGEYAFTLQEGGAYNIRPLSSSCDANPLNGITTFDLVLMSKHILGVELLDSPYKIIAADVDHSNELSQDTIILRQMVLGIIAELPGGSFRFVLKDYVFPAPFDPFTPPFPESYSISNLQGEVTGIDFIGIRKGNVSGTPPEAFECNDFDLPARIFGKVFRDQNNDCLYDTGEPGMQGWNVSASDGTNTFYATTNASGAYEIEVIPGTYEVALSNPDGLWGGCPDAVQGVEATLQDLGAADFGLHPEVLCPSMQIDLSTLLLRRCFSSSYQAHYCNTGTVTAENARVEIRFDTFFTILSSTLPWSAVSGNTYTFELGDVPAGDCGDFWVTFEVGCDAVLGQTHCTEAHIFPDTVCAAPSAWSGAELRVQGHCVGDEVQFVIVNQGTDMLTPANYIVVEDIVVMTPPISNPFTLASNSSEVITVPANGATWRLEAQQPVGYPWGTVASATVEGCGANPAGQFSTGFVNQFPPDDQAPFVDIDCRENIGSFDPNDKQGFPTGVLAEHYIPLEQPLEYLIRFQNTGTDTAFSVVVRDTLDLDLDIASIRPLGSSHPYTFDFQGQNVAQFVFANILLPDSNVNEPASHGYLKFSIVPRKDLPNGTVIENEAAIFFDFNDPVITNTTWHTLGEKYLDVSNVVFSPGIGLEVFPNPATDAATFLLKSAHPLRGTLTVFDLSGRAVRVQDFEHNQFTFKSHALQAGCYFFKITSEGQPLAAGKLVVLEK
ncbi:MAG: SdrD B-like domain-containing protein [Saprospiraceae bacterium]